MRFVGNRALLGAAAMIIVGIVLSMMSSNFFADDDGLIRSRWWWEIVLNSQILCAAFIWFTHIDQVKSSSGRRVWAKGFQMFAGMIAVLLPVWLALISIYLGWFEEAPPIATAKVAVALCLLAWWLAWLINLAAESFVHRKLIRPWFLRAQTLWGKLLRILPVTIAMLLAIEETIRGGDLHYKYCPFLFYLQGAVPYFAQSIRIGDARLDDEDTLPAMDAE